MSGKMYRFEKPTDPNVEQLKTDIVALTAKKDLFESDLPQTLSVASRTKALPLVIADLAAKQAELDQLMGTQPNN